MAVLNYILYVISQSVSHAAYMEGVANNMTSRYLTAIVMKAILAMIAQVNILLVINLSCYSFCIMIITS